MAHASCSLKTSTPRVRGKSLIDKLYSKLILSTLVSNENPISIHLFRSPVSIKMEQERQLKTTNFAVHPYSKFKKWYDIFLIFIYSSTLVTKPLEFGFTTEAHYKDFNFYNCYTIVVSFLYFIHIVINFTLGYIDEESETVELRFRQRAKHYLLGPHFLCDVVSSMPRALPFDVLYANKTSLLIPFVNICCLFRIARLVSLILCIQRVCDYMRLKSMGALLLFHTFFIVLNIIHWMTCLQFGVPRMVRFYLLTENQDESWINRYNLLDETLCFQYFMSFFKSSAYILGIRISKAYEEKLPEEYIIGVLTYFLGKIIVGFLWIVLAVAILNSKTMDTKFLELMNQLDAYMNKKKLPLNLRERISQYYHYKYQSKYINEDLMNGMLSNNLKKEVNMHVCKSLIESVSLFANLNPQELNNVVQYLVPEIFLPNDTIIHHGTYGDAMYFLSSGTVAVYTYSGKEICHLQDGAYFGEISLMLKGQTRVGTVVAIETSQVYRLDRSKFDKSLFKNKQVMNKMKTEVARRLEETGRVEEQYKKELFKKTFQKHSSFSQ